MSPSNIVYSVFAFVGSILPILLLPTQLRVKNIGTCSYIVWTSLLCFVGFVNSIRWHGNVTNWAPAWCDICVRLLIGGRVAIPAASLCILRRLRSATKDSAEPLHNNKQWRTVVLDLSIALGIPILSMISAYIVESRRFLIIEDIGCYFDVASVLPTYPLFVIWPAVIGLALLIYSGLVIHDVMKMQAYVHDLMREDGNLKWDEYHYKRLLTLVTIVFLCSFPTSIFEIVQDVVLNPMQPWTGWAAVHARTPEVDMYTTADINSVPGLGPSLQWGRWCYIVYALVFFMFFASAKHARRRCTNTRSAAQNNLVDVPMSGDRSKVKSLYFGQSLVWDTPPQGISPQDASYTASDQSLHSFPLTPKDDPA